MQANAAFMAGLLHRGTKGGVGDDTPAGHHRPHAGLLDGSHGLADEYVHDGGLKAGTDIGLALVGQTLEARRWFCRDRARDKARQS